MNKEGLGRYETSYLVLIVIFIVQIFLLFLDIYMTQRFTIENFTIIVVQLIAILFSYFWGLLPAAIFSTIYILGYIVYAVYGEKQTSLISYSLMLFVPLSIIYSGSMNRTRREIINDLNKLADLEEMKLKLDPNTNLENESAFREVLSKQVNLAYRYEEYKFSLYMFRLEFIETLRNLLDVKEFNNLLEEIAEVIQGSIREEDYKFSVNGDRFVIITPLTSSSDIAPAIRRILERVERINIRDRYGDEINITLKAGGLDYSRDGHEMFKDYKRALLELQKATEVDVYGEYSN